MPDSPIKIPASVGILSLNNAAEIARTLASVRDFADVYICDGNSIDGTPDIARRFGARVEKQFDTDEPNQRITDFSATRTRCLNQARYPWYVRVDADEYLSPEVVEEIRDLLSGAAPPLYRIYKMPRKYVWRGKVIDHTITYPNYQIRFFRRDATEGYRRIAHERLVLKPGEPIGMLKHCQYVPLPDTYQEFDAGRTKRALKWDELQYRKFGTFPGWLKGTFSVAAHLAVYSLRLVKVRMLPGNKLPLAFELWRFKYQILTWGLYTRVMAQKIFE